MPFGAEEAEPPGRPQRPINLKELKRQIVRCFSLVVADGNVGAGGCRGPRIPDHQVARELSVVRVFGTKSGVN